MLISTLKNAKFRNYFWADIISGFGAGMSFIGANWFVLERSGSNKSVGILLMIFIFGGLLAFPFAGTIADRFNRKTVMITSNAFRALAILFVAFTILTKTFRIDFIYFMALVSGLGWGIFIPASRGFIQEILTSDEYINGSSLIEISLQVGMFSAAAVCGIIYKYLGFSAILLIDAGAFVIGSYLLSRISHQSQTHYNGEQSFYDQFMNGARYLRQNPSIFAFGVIMFIPFVATLVSNVVSPGYVRSHLHESSVVFGLADMSYGIGACLSGFVAVTLAAKMEKFKVTIFFFLISVFSLIYLTANNTVAGLYIACIFFGLANSSIRVVMTSQIMETVPKEFMGRCQSVWLSISMIMQIATSYGIGTAIDHVPVRFGFLLLALIMIIGLFSLIKFIPRTFSVTTSPEVSI